MNEFKKNHIIAILKMWDIDVLVDTWNQYTEFANKHEKYIYVNNDEGLDDMFAGFGHPVSEALRAAQYGNYEWSDRYVVFNRLGNLESVDYCTDVYDYIDFDDLAEYVCSEGTYELQDIWYEDVAEGFEDYYYDKYHKEIPNGYEDILENEEYDLISNDWDEIAEEIHKR